MSTPTVRFFAYINLSDISFLGTYAIEKKNDTPFKNESKAIAGKLKQMNLRPEERQKVSTPNGSWFCRVDANEVASLLLCTSEYPERHSYKMIDDAEKNIAKIPDYYTANPDDVAKSVRKSLSELCKKYNDLKSIDKVYAAQSHVDDISNMMKDNLTNQMSNMSKMQEMEDKSAAFKNDAELFKDQSKDLEKAAYMRAMKMRILLGGTIALIILLIWII